MIYGLIFAAFWGLLWIIRRDTFKHGKEEQQKEMTDEELHDIFLVKNARDRLSDVNDSSDKLRKKYTRK